MNRSQWLASAVLTTLLATNLLVTVLPRQSKAGMSGNYIVRLYSGGRVVAQWRTTELDALDVTQASDSLLFPVGLGVDTGLVRVQGTWSVEPEGTTGYVEDD